MEKYSEITCSLFVDILASKEPVPGGGGAAALCGAIGTALGHMVGSLTTGKKKYADVEEEILVMMSRCEKLQAELLKLIDEDAEAFKPLSQAYRLPAETEEEKALKERTMEQCSKDACQVPLQIMKCCCEAIDLASEFADKGSKLAVSDAGCAAAILEGALKAASLNIFINTKGLLDRAYAEAINQETLKMLDSYTNKADAVFGRVQNSLM